MADNYQRYMTAADVCDLLQISRPTLHRLTSRRQIPHYKVCGRLRFRRDHLDQWISEHSIPVEQPYQVRI